MEEGRFADATRTYFGDDYSWRVPRFRCERAISDWLPEVLHLDTMLTWWQNRDDRSTTGSENVNAQITDLTQSVYLLLLYYWITGCLLVPLHYITTVIWNALLLCRERMQKCFKMLESFARISHAYFNGQIILLKTEWIFPCSDGNWSIIRLSVQGSLADRSSAITDDGPTTISMSIWFINTDEFNKFLLVDHKHSGSNVIISPLSISSPLPSPVSSGV